MLSRLTITYICYEYLQSSTLYLRANKEIAAGLRLLTVETEEASRSSGRRDGRTLQIHATVTR
jgi:hypothetical protein